VLVRAALNRTERTNVSAERWEGLVGIDQSTVEQLILESELLMWKLLLFYRGFPTSG
jgi:hypothetical protein